MVVFWENIVVLLEKSGDILGKYGGILGKYGGTRCSAKVAPPKFLDALASLGLMIVTD